MNPYTNGAATPRDEARLPLQPLLDALPIDHTLARPDVPGPGVAAQAATLLGVSTRTIHRLKNTGVTPDTADRLAITAGLHPLIVWGDTWTKAMQASDRSLAREAAPDYAPLELSG